MGNVGVGLADDYFALFSNPAGLSTQKSYELTIGISNYGYGNEVRYLGTLTDDKINATNLDNIGFVWPIPTIRGGLTFAFGFGRIARYASVATFEGYNSNNSIVQSFYPFSYAGGVRNSYDLLNLSLEDANDLLNNNIPFQIFLADTSNDYLYTILRGDVNQVVRVRESGGLNSWSFGGGIDIAPNMSLGVTLNYITGTYSYDREFSEVDSRNVHNSTPDDLDYWTYTSTINGDISGFNVLLGLMVRKEDRLRVGFSVRIPTYYEVSEVFTDEGRSFFDNGDSYSVLYEGRTKYNVITPYVLSGGISFRPKDWLMLAGDAEYVDWTQMRFDTDNMELLRENRNIKAWMRDTWTFRGGAELTLWKWGINLRGGFEWKPSPWKGDPSDFDQWNYTFGIGYSDEGSSINFSYAMGSFKTYRVNYYLGNVPGSKTDEKVSTTTINITFSQKF